MNEKVVRNSILINADSSSVWDALTSPSKTRIYMFGCETVSDWEKGSSLLWNGQYEGKEVTFVKGAIIDIQPGKMLKYTVIDPNASYPDIPENYLNVTYELAAEEGGTRLTVSQDGFETAADGENRYKDVYNDGHGWDPILQQIKSLVEESGT